MPPIGRLKTKRQDFFQKKAHSAARCASQKISSYVGIIQIRLRVKAFAYSQPARASSPVSFNLLYSLCLFPSRKNCCPKATVRRQQFYVPTIPANAAAQYWHSIAANRAPDAVQTPIFLHAACPANILCRAAMPHTLCASDTPPRPLHPSPARAAQDSLRQHPARSTLTACLHVSIPCSSV